MKKLSDVVGNKVVKNTKFNTLKTKVNNIEKNLVTATLLNTKISEVENKIVDNSKYITTQGFNKLTAENFAARFKEAHLVNKT